MNFENITIKEYLDLLGMKKSTPGGGSSLALVLLNAISLCEMVCNFTKDKVGYESFRKQVIKYQNELEQIKKEAYILLNKDSESFLKLMDAYKQKDEKLIEESSLEACEVPYSLYCLTKRVEEISMDLSTNGNKNVISDSIIGHDLCLAIYNGCKLNIKANINAIKDKDALNKYQSIL